MLGGFYRRRGLAGTCISHCSEKEADPSSIDVSSSKSHSKEQGNRLASSGNSVDLNKEHASLKERFKPAGSAAGPEELSHSRGRWLDGSFQGKFKVEDRGEPQSEITYLRQENHALRKRVSQLEEDNEMVLQLNQLLLEKLHLLSADFSLPEQYLKTTS